jgi:YHS domain-containing protein
VNRKIIKYEVFDVMMENDPVCFKTLDTDKEHRRARYKARDFYFCSDKCEETFERKPDIYYNIAI